MSSRGKKLVKTEKRARRLDTDAQKLDKLVKATAAALRTHADGPQRSAEDARRRPAGWPNRVRAPSRRGARQ